MGNRIAENTIIKSVKKFWNEEDGMGVVEIVLIYGCSDWTCNNI